jgi:hypothetical protein
MDIKIHMLIFFFISCWRVGKKCNSYKDGGNYYGKRMKSYMGVVIKEKEWAIYKDGDSC